jgi:hypothetical protein
MDVQTERRWVPSHLSTAPEIVLATLVTTRHRTLD